MWEDRIGERMAGETLSSRAEGYAQWTVPEKALLLTAGVDNLFDRTYAEHLSRGGAMVSGYEQTTKVNEPGRTLWMKLDLNF